MGHTGKNKSTKQNQKNAATVEVLYQKMGDRWFAFSLVNDEVFVGSISQEEIDEIATHDVQQKSGPHPNT